MRSQLFHEPETVSQTLEALWDAWSDAERLEAIQWMHARNAPQRSLTTSGGGFEQFWATVHRKVGKEAAKKAYKAAVTRLARDSGTSAVCAMSTINAAMAVFARSPRAHAEITGQIHPATWLRQGRYEDDPATWHETQSTGLTNDLLDYVKNG